MSSAASVKCKKCGSVGGHGVVYKSSGQETPCGYINFYEWFRVTCWYCGFSWSDSKNIEEYEVSRVVTYHPSHPLYKEKTDD